MNKKDIVMHAINSNAPMNLSELFEKTHEHTGQNKNSLSVMIADLIKTNLIYRNQHQRYELTDEGEKWIVENVLDALLLGDEPPLPLQKLLIFLRETIRNAAVDSPC